MTLQDAIAAMTPARAWVESKGQEGHTLRVYPTGRGTAYTAITDPNGNPMLDGLNVHSLPIVPGEEYPVLGLGGLQARAAAHGFTDWA